MHFARIMRSTIALFITSTIQRPTFWEKTMQPLVDIKHIETDTDLDLSFSVMKELRPHLNDRAAYAVQIARQRMQGYRLLAAWRDGAIVGLAGYRLQDNLLYGRFIYVDDRW
jgi:hypothetical protein